MERTSESRTENIENPRENHVYVNANAPNQDRTRPGDNEQINSSRYPAYANYGATSHSSSCGDIVAKPDEAIDNYQATGGASSGVQTGSLPTMTFCPSPSTASLPIITISPSHPSNWHNTMEDSSDTDYGYMPGMNVEITQSDNDMAAPNLPEGLRHVMLHVIGSRPNEEVKFRRLKYRMDTDGLGVQDNVLLPRGRKVQRPGNIRRQTSSRRGRTSRQVSREISESAPPGQLSRQQSCDPVMSVTSAGGQDGELENDVFVQDASSLRSASHRQKGVLVVLAINDLMTSMALSILAPFFPKEARNKGISEATSGWVFGIFALAQCLSSPIFGKLLPRVGAKFLSQSGQFFAGGCTILFGLLQYVSTEDGSIIFIVYCFVLRVFMAMGCAASGTAAFAIAARTFPDNPATIFGLLETAVGFGLMMGPAIGGVLYEVGGFMVPFVVIGSAMVLSVPVGLCVLPSDVIDDRKDSDADSTICDFLRIPAVTVTALAAFIACLAWVMPDPTLEPHLSKFNLSPTVIGMVFLLMSACYAICSPVWGWVADNMPDSSPLMVVGFAGTGIGFLILGPTPLFQLPKGFEPLWLNIIGLIIIGLMVSLALVPTYDKILDAAEKAGIDDTLANCSTVAGIWNSAYCFGEFVGPVVAGWMTGKVGFGWTMSLAAGLCFLMAIVMLGLIIYERKVAPEPITNDVQTVNQPTSDISQSSERTPLLNPVRVSS